MRDWLVMLFLAFLCLGCVSGVAIEGLAVSNQVVHEWNHLTFSLDSDEVHGGGDLWYHFSHIYLGPESTSKKDSSFVFEGGFSLGGGNLPDKVLLEKSLPKAISRVGGLGKSWGEDQWCYGKMNDCIYKIEANGDLAGIFQSLESMNAHATILHTSYLPRVEVHQFFQGQWEKLSRFAVLGGDMSFHLAPQDTIRLRLSTAVMKVIYYPDRMVIEKTTGLETQGLSLKVVRAPNGYWPFKAKGTFFQEFQSAILDIGDVFEYSYVADPGGLYTLGLYVEDMKSKPMTDEMVLHFSGPDLWVNSVFPDFISSWPLIPVPKEILSQSSEVDWGYPGGKIYPLWAIKKGLEMGGGFSGIDKNNMLEYGGIVKSWYEKVESERR